MHVEDGILYGLVAHQRILEGGNLAVSFEDIDSTPSVGIVHWKFVQTKTLTELGVAINPKGIIIVCKKTYDAIRFGLIPEGSVWLQIKYNDEYYVSDLANVILENVDYFEYYGDSPRNDDINLNPTIPPITAMDDGKILKVSGATIAFAEDEGGTVFYITLLENDEHELYAYLDYNTILSNIQNGMCAIVEYGGKYYELTKILIDRIVFTHIADADGEVSTAIVDNRNLWVVDYHASALVPATEGTLNSGKVLAVAGDGNTTEWIDPPANELPEIEVGYEGKVLTVNSTAENVEWADIPEELPTINSGDAGKVLTVNANEDGVEWGSAGGGGKYMHAMTIRAYQTDSVNMGFFVGLTMVSTSSQAVTASTFNDFLRNAGVPTSGIGYPCTSSLIPIESANNTYFCAGHIIPTLVTNGLVIYGTKVEIDFANSTTVYTGTRGAALNATIIDVTDYVTAL